MSWQHCSAQSSELPKVLIRKGAPQQLVRTSSRVKPLERIFSIRRRTTIVLTENSILPRLYARRPPIEDFKGSVGRFAYFTKKMWNFYKLQQKLELATLLSPHLLLILWITFLQHFFVKANFWNWFVVFFLREIKFWNFFIKLPQFFVKATSYSICLIYV